MKNTLPITLRISSVVLQLGYVKAYTHSLTLVELGYCFYLTALSYSINALIMVPADFYQQAHLVEYYEGAFPLGSVLSLNKNLLLIAAAMAVLLGSPMCLAGKLRPPHLLLIFALAISLYLSTSLRNYLNNRGHSLFTGSMLFMEAGLKVSSFVLFLILGLSHISAFVLSTVAAFMIEAICLAVFFLRRVPYSWAAAADMDIAGLLQTSGAVSFSAVCNWLQLQGYRIVYVWLGLPAVAGLYAAVSNIGTLGMNASATVFSQTLLPRVYSSKGKYVFLYFKWSMLLCLAVLLGYLALGKLLLFILTKREFVPYSNLMIFGIFVETGNLFIGAASAYFTIKRASSRLLAANIAGLLTSAFGVSLCLTWKPQSYYLLGAVLTTSQLVVCAVLFRAAQYTGNNETENE